MNLLLQVPQLSEDGTTYHFFSAHVLRVMLLQVHIKEWSSLVFSRKVLLRKGCQPWFYELFEIFTHEEAHLHPMPHWIIACQFVTQNPNKLEKFPPRLQVDPCLPSCFCNIPFSEHAALSPLQWLLVSAVLATASCKIWHHENCVSQGVPKCVVVFSENSFSPGTGCRRMFRRQSVNLTILVLSGS